MWRSLSQILHFQNYTSIVLYVGYLLLVVAFLSSGWEASSVQCIFSRGKICVILALWATDKLFSSVSYCSIWDHQFYKMSSYVIIIIFHVRCDLRYLLLKLCTVVTYVVSQQISQPSKLKFLLGCHLATNSFGLGRLFYKSSWQLQTFKCHGNQNGCNYLEGCIL